MTVALEFPAQTAGSREVQVRARVTGILLKRNYEEGVRVRARRAAVVDLYLAMGG